MSTPSDESTRPFTETLELGPSFESNKTQWEPRAAAAALEAATDTPPLKSTATELKPVNRQIEDLTQALTTASLSSVPDARLIIAYPHYPDGKGMEKDSAIIRLPQTVSGCDLIGVVQRSQDVDFIISLPFYGRPLEKISPRMIPFQLQCHIYYIPAADDCLLVNKTIVDIFLTNLDPLSSRDCVSHMEKRVIRPGMWRISVTCNEDGKVEEDLVDFLVLRRRFDVLIHERPSDVSASSKRTPIGEGAEYERDGKASFKRQKLRDVTEILIAPPARLSATALEPIAAASHDPVYKPIPSRDIVLKDATPLLDLADGEVAVVRTTWSSTHTGRALRDNPGSQPATYELRRIKQIGTTRSTSVFASKHSEISENIVVKVLKYQSTSSQALDFVAETWKREKTILEKLRHINIMSLEAFDGRLFALYVEYLPPSLHRGTTSTFATDDSYRILQDTSSALAYLADKNVVHNDIKPGNIAYSPGRGAVLLDFGMATVGRHRGAPGGTPWYLPPEFMEDQTRGFPGDVFALGITMLYVLGIIEFPDVSGHGWLIHEVFNRRSESRGRMHRWLDSVSVNRMKLSQLDKVESLVYKMLDDERESRIESKMIASALQALEVDDSRSLA